MRSDPGEFWSGGSVIDLTLDDPTSPERRSHPDRSSTDTQISLLRRRRKVVLTVLAVFVVVVLTDALVGKVMHDQRQRHLAAEIAEPIEKVPNGGAALVLQIPSIGLNRIVVEGASAAELRGGPGRVASSAMPTAPQGVTLILGHRSRYGGPFSLLGDIKEGDLIAIKTRSQEIRRYEVTAMRRSDAPVTTRPDTRLALVTSAAGRFDRRFLVVEARAEADSPAGGGAPETSRTTTNTRGRFDRSELDRRPGVTSALIALVILVALAVATLAFGRWSEGRYERAVQTAAWGILGAAAALMFMSLLDHLLPTTG